MLTVEIPAALIQAGLSETLRANEGQIKSTEFQQIYLNNMRSTLISGGIRVSGNWTFKYRERIARNPFTGRWTHTPWGTEEGTFYQDFGVSFSNGRLIASTSARPSISSSSWYSVIIDEIIHHQEVRQNVRQGLDNELSNFNGLNLQAMLVQYGASTAASQLGVNQDQVASFINSNVSGINANFDSNRLAISLRIPSLQSLVGQNSKLPSARNDFVQDGFYRVNAAGAVWQLYTENGTPKACGIASGEHLANLGGEGRVSVLSDIGTGRTWTGTCSIADGFYRVNAAGVVWQLYTENGTSMACGIASGEHLARRGGANRVRTVPSGAEAGAQRNWAGTCPI